MVEAEGFSRTLQVTLFVFLVLLAMLVVLTCIWKIVRLIARFQIETRIERWEAEAAEAEGNKDGNTVAKGLSAAEARSLRRLSVLAGFNQEDGSPCCRWIKAWRRGLANMLAPQRNDNRQGKKRDPEENIAAIKKNPLPNGKAVSVVSHHDEATMSVPAPAPLKSSLRAPAPRRVAPASPEASPNFRNTCALHANSNLGNNNKRLSASLSFQEGEHCQRRRQKLRQHPPHTCCHNHEMERPRTRTEDEEDEESKNYDDSVSSTWTPELETARGRNSESRPPIPSPPSVPPPPLFRISSAPSSRRFCTVSSSAKHRGSMGDGMDGGSDYQETDNNSNRRHSRRHHHHHHHHNRHHHHASNSHVHHCSCGASFPNLPLLSFPYPHPQPIAYYPRGQPPYTSSYGSHPNIVEPQLLLRSPSPYFLPYYHSHHLPYSLHQHHHQQQQQQQQQQHKPQKPESSSSTASSDEDDRNGLTDHGSHKTSTSSPVNLPFPSFFTFAQASSERRPTKPSPPSSTPPPPPKSFSEDAMARADETSECDEREEDGEGDEEESVKMSNKDPHRDNGT